MRNKPGYFLTGIAILGLVSGCYKETCEPADEPGKQEKLTGTWHWVRTDGGIAAHIHRTPANTGKNVDLKLTEDGRYAIYTNSVLTSDGTYTLETRRCIHDHNDKTYINFSSGIDLMVEKLSNGRLEVSDEAYDGLGSVYER